jgi:hypothetical protein
MSVMKKTLRMFVAAALAVTSQFALTQATYAQAEGGYHPFSEPMEFDPDWQFFAPIQSQDMQDLTARQRANTGFYATYDRMYFGATRPKSENANNAIDFGWGNRFDFGLMKSNESGWSFSAQYVGGPNKSNVLEQQRLNQFVGQALGGNGPAGGPSQATTGTLPFLPRFNRNDIDGERLFLLQDSVNVASFGSFEANKTWRLEPYRYGGILEPLVGLRTIAFTDYAQNDTYTSGGIIIPPATTATFAQETLREDRVVTANNMLLGQLGFRYTKFVNRWTLSNDTKFFGGAVFQNQQTSIINTIAVYPNPVTIGTAPLSDNDHTGSTFSGRKNEESTWGFDTRVEASYKATKHLDVRGGFTMIYLDRGVWRGATSTSQGSQFQQNQGVVMPAFTFGLALNR